MTTPTVAVLVEPPSKRLQQDRFFDSASVPTGGDDLQAPWRHFKTTVEARGIPVHTSDRLDDLPPECRKLFISVSGLSDYRALARRPDVVLSTYIALECPAVEPALYRRLPAIGPLFTRILNWSDSEALRPYTRRNVDIERIVWPQSYDAVHLGLWSRRQRKFLVMINSNKLPRSYVNELYTKRLEAVEFFHRYGEIDLFGPYWRQAPIRVGKSWVPHTFRRWYRRMWELRQRVLPNHVYAAAAGASRGIAASKSSTLAEYDFALCFENQVLRGWITEKLFDCVFAGTIPVYWGAPNVTDLIPAEAFIDMRQFAGFSELRSYLKSLDTKQRDQLRDAGRAFVESERFRPFRMSTFTAQLEGFVLADATSTTRISAPGRIRP